MISIPSYWQHALALHIIPVLLAGFGSRLTEREQRKPLVREGIVFTVLLFTLVVSVPNLGTYYNNGPRASEGFSAEMLPIASTLVYGLLWLFTFTKVPRPVRAISASILGLWPLLASGYIS